MLDTRSGGKGAYSFPYETKTFEGFESFDESMDYADKNRLTRMQVFVKP